MVGRSGRGCRLVAAAAHQGNAPEKGVRIADDMGRHPPADALSGLWSAVAGILSGLLGAMGLGGGGILIIYLSIFTSIPQAQAQGINPVSYTHLCRSTAS